MRERFVEIVLRRRIDGLTACVIEVVAKSLVKSLLRVLYFSDVLEIRYHDYSSSKLIGEHKAALAATI